MTQINTMPTPSKTLSYVSVNSIETEKTENQPQEHAHSKQPCSTHGNSTPFIDRELQSARGQEIIQILSTALNDLADESKCTKCTVENIAALLEAQVKDLQLAKQNGEWSKEDKKTLKAETKSLFKPAKKSLKKMWKGN